jgi:outer membrane lipoprotein-sorting protein
MKKTVFTLIFIMIAGFVFTCTFSGCTKIKEAFQEKKSEVESMADKAEGEAKDIIKEGKEAVK